MSFDDWSVPLLVGALAIAWLGGAVGLYYEEARHGELRESDTGLYTLAWPLELVVYLLGWPWREAKRRGERRGGWKK